MLFARKAELPPDSESENDDMHYFTEDARFREESRIKVGVRVRPFNYREIDEACDLVVDMNEDGIVNLDMNSVGKGTKTLAFDYTFWSFDGSKKKATQESVYEQLGFFISEALSGYNCAIFTYGQTGTGKSYSLMGSMESQGILYRGLQEFFERQSQTKDTTTELEISFLEIYNENVRDLLAFDNLKRLRVRIDKTEGMFVQGLSIKAVASYEQATWLIDTGFRNRTVASTKMNTASSRSHCIFSMYIKSIVMKGDEKTLLETQTKIDLIDLAGSEKQSRMAAAGIRLREAGHINHSLTTLLNIIAALSKNDEFVPYRSSVLTTITRTSLGGNCKTIVLCTISPSYNDVIETWATLRFGSRIRTIINKIKMQGAESSYKLTQRMKQNVQVLKKRMADAKKPSIKSYAGKLYKQELVDKLSHLQSVVFRREKTHDERCLQLKQDINNLNQQLLHLGLCDMLRTSEEYRNTPRLINISPDPIMTGRLIYFLRPFNAEILIGTEERVSPDDHRLVILCSKTAEVKEVHAMMTLSGTVIQLTPKDPESCDVFVNGSRVDKATNIFHGDRLVFGSGQVCFQVISPSHHSPHPGRRSHIIDYEMISKEQQEKNTNVIKLQEMLIGSREMQIEKTRILQNNYTTIELRLMQTKTEEKDLRHRLNNKKMGKKERRNLITLYLSRKKYRESLEKEMVENIEMMERCRILDGLIEGQLTSAFSLCRLSGTMARVNCINSVYSSFTVPFWDGEMGLPNEKVMLMEAFHMDNFTIDCMYDFDSFELRHTLQAEYEFRDRLSKCPNPFVPDMPTRCIGVAHIKHMPNSLEPLDFIIRPVGSMIGSRGTIRACLSLEQDESEFQITLSVENIVIRDFDDPKLMKVISFINPCGLFEIVQGTTAEEGKSFGFPDIKILTESTPGLHRYLKTQGIKVFVAVYAFQGLTSMPDWIFHKLMACQIELKRSKELRYEKEKSLTCCKKELHEIKSEMFYSNEAHNKATRQLLKLNATLKKIKPKPRFEIAKYGLSLMPFRRKRLPKVSETTEKPPDQELELECLNISKHDVILPKLHLLASCFEDINYRFSVFDSTLNMIEKGWDFPSI